LAIEDFGHVYERRLRALLDFWLEARCGSLVPSATAIEPARFVSALPVIWLCEVVENEGTGRFRYRLVGDHVRAAYGTNIVGKTLEEVTDKSALARVVGYFNQVADLPAVVHVYGRVFAEALQPANGERLILPFADPRTGRVSRVLGATVHSWSAPGQPTGPVPDRQVRTFTPVDGSGAWCEWWL